MAETSQGTVLVVDDEPTIVEVVGRYMERAGYETLEAADGPEALRRRRTRAAPTSIVLDVMLPGIDGIEVMRQLHERPGPPVPVILLTARGEESDRLVGLRRGADDYVVKPFSPEELVARVDAVLRRVSPPAEEAAPPIELGPLRVDPATRRSCLDGEELSLTQREFDLLAYLAAHPGQVFSRDQLMDAVWDCPSSPTPAPSPSTSAASAPSSATTRPQPRFIETVWGVGYRLRP